MSDKTKRNATIAGLVRRGMSVRAISEELGRGGIKLGKSQVAELVAAARAERHAGGAPTRRGAKPTPAPTAADSPPVERPAVIADVAALDALDLASLRALDARLDTALTEEVEPKTLVALTDCKIRLAVAMARLAPPAVVDPLTDPTNLEARDVVIARIGKMIANAQPRTAA